LADSYFATNLGYIKKKNAAWAELLDAQREGRADLPETGDIRSLECIPAKNGLPTLKAEHNGDVVFLHSRYDPRKEAKDIVDNAYNSKQNYFAVLGLGLGYTAEALLDRAEGKILIVEPNPEVFLKAMEHRDLSKILSSDRVALSVGEDWTSAFSSWMKIAKLYEIGGVGIIELPGSLKTAPDGYFEHFKEKMKAHIVTLGGNLQTVMLMGWEYQRNTLASLPRILDNPPVRLLFDKFKSHPGIIVSAGPSLNKNFDQIKELKGRAVIIAVDTSLKPLLKAGIEPDLICTGDPQLANYKHLAGAKVEKACLVAEPMTHPQSMIDFDGKLFIASFADKMMQWLARSIGDVGHVMCWGSVATMAFDLARKLGCDPIIFTGQDLSFPGGRTYVEGTYFEEEEKRDMSLEAFEKRQVTYEMEDIYGNPVKTNRQMFAYLNWFNYEISRTQAKVVNATEGGILKQGVEVLALKETAEKYVTGDFDVTGMIHSARDEFEAYNLPLLKAHISSALESFGRINNVCNKNLELLKDTMLKLQGFQKYPPSLCQDVLNTLDADRLRIAGEPGMKDFIEFANQTGMFNFVKKFNKIQGSKFTTHVMDESIDLYTNLYQSTRRTIGKVRPFFEQALKVVNERGEK